MPKQHRTPGQKPPERREEGPKSEQTGEIVGNAALQERMAGGAVTQSGVAPLDVVRDTALPVVGHALIGLQLVPRGDQIDRFVDVLSRSHLPDDRKSELIERLRSDEAVAAQVREAVERWFGPDSESVREGINKDLAQVEAALLDGAAAEGGWQLGSQQFALSSIEGSITARADAMIGDLATGLGLGAEAVQGFCRDVHLALMWLEEEDEELEGEPISAELT